MSDFLSNLWSRSRGDIVGVKPRVPNRFDPPAINFGGESPLPIEIDVEHEGSLDRPERATTTNRVRPEKPRDVAPRQPPQDIELRPIMPERPRPAARPERADERPVVEVEASEVFLRIPLAPSGEPPMVSKAPTVHDGAPSQRVIRLTSPPAAPAQSHAEESPAQEPVVVPARQPRDEVEHDDSSRFFTSDQPAIAEVSPAPPPWGTSQAASFMNQEVPDSRISNDPKSLVEYRVDTVTKAVLRPTSSTRPRIESPPSVPVKVAVTRPSDAPHTHSGRASTPATIEVADPSSTPAEPVVQVTIGRIEIRAETPQAARREHTAPAVMSLTDYLKHRAEGAQR